MRSEVRFDWVSAGRKLAGIATAAALMLTTGALNAGAQDAGKLTKIRMAGSEGMNHAVPFFVAMKKGYFKEAGLDVELLIMSPGAPMIAALSVGQVDVAMASAAQFLGSIAQGVTKGKLIGENTENNYMIMANPNIKDPKQIKGKAFGISGQNSGDHVWAQAVMSHYGIKPDDVNWIALGNPATRLAGLVNGSVDAIQMNAASMPEEAKKYILLDVDQSPVSWLANAIYARQEMIDNQKPVLKKFLTAIGKGAMDARADPKVAMAGCLDSGSPEAVCRDVVNFVRGSKNPYNWSSTSTVNRSAIEAMLPGVGAAVPGAEKMKPEDFVDFSIAGELKN